MEKASFVQQARITSETHKRLIIRGVPVGWSRVESRKNSMQSRRISGSGLLNNHYLNLNRRIT